MTEKVKNKYKWILQGEWYRKNAAFTRLNRNSIRPEGR